MSNQVIKGKQLMVFMNGKSVAAATTHSLNITTETADTTSKDTGGMFSEIEVTKVSWTMSTENLFCIDGTGATYDELFDALVAGTKVKLVFTSKTTTEKSLDEAPEAGWTSNIQINSAGGVISATGDPGYIGTAYYGYAYITDLSLNAANGDNATYTATFTGSGVLKKLTA